MPRKSITKKRSPYYYAQRGLKRMESWSKKEIKITPKEIKNPIILRGFDTKKLTPAELRKEEFGVSKAFSYHPPITYQRSIFNLVPWTHAERLYLAGMVRRQPYVFEVQISTHGRKMFRMIKETFGYQYYQVLRDVSFLLFNFYVLVEKFGEQVIMKYVPSDTGALRTSLIRSMMKPLSIVPQENPFIPSHIKLKLSVYSDKKYLNYVNTGTYTHPKTGKKHKIQLAHSGYTQSRRTGKLLFDPDAKYDSLSFVRMKIKERANKEYKNFLRQIANVFGIKYMEAKRFFTTKGIRG